MRAKPEPHDWVPPGDTSSPVNQPGSARDAKCREEAGGTPRPVCYWGRPLSAGNRARGRRVLLMRYLGEAPALEGRDEVGHLDEASNCAVRSCVMLSMKCVNTRRVTT